MIKLRATILVVWMIGLAALLLAGRYSLFIRAELWPLLLATTLMFALLLGALVGRLGKAARSVTPVALLQGVMLMLPLVYMAVNVTGAAASGLGSFALEKRSLGSGDGGLATETQPAPDAKPADANKVMSLAYVMQHPKTLSGTRVVTEGRVSRDESQPADEATIFRFVIVCCAADATPAHTLIKSPDVAKLKNDDWVRVDGTLKTIERDGVRETLIENPKIEAIAAPNDPYLTPY